MSGRRRFVNLAVAASASPLLARPVKAASKDNRIVHENSRPGTVEWQLKQFAAPNIVDEHVDVSVILSNPLGQVLHLVVFEMVDCGCNTSAAEVVASSAVSTIDSARL